MLESFWDHFGLDVRCSVFYARVFDVRCYVRIMFDVRCYCRTYDLLVFEGVFDLTFVSVRLTLFSAGPDCHP